MCEFPSGHRIIGRQLLQLLSIALGVAFRDIIAVQQGAYADGVQRRAVRSPHSKSSELAWVGRARASWWPLIVGGDDYKSPALNTWLVRNADIRTLTSSGGKATKRQSPIIADSLAKVLQLSDLLDKAQATWRSPFKARSTAHERNMIGLIWEKKAKTPPKALPTWSGKWGEVLGAAQLVPETLLNLSDSGPPVCEL